MNHGRIIAPLAFGLEGEHFQIVRERTTLVQTEIGEEKIPREKGAVHAEKRREARKDPLIGGATDGGTQKDHVIVFKDDVMMQCCNYRISIPLKFLSIPTPLAPPPLTRNGSTTLPVFSLQMVRYSSLSCFSSRSSAETADASETSDACCAFRVGTSAAGESECEGDERSEAICCRGRVRAIVRATGQFSRIRRRKGIS